jgi:hypothetical protein
MQRFGCAFVNDADASPELVLSSLFLGIAICSRTFEDFLAFIDDKKALNKWSKNWDKQIRKALRKNQINMLDKVFEFQTYMKDSIAVPKYWEENEDGETSGAHWTQSVYGVLTAHLNYSATEALNIPLARALAENFKYLESQGALTLMQDWQIEEEEKINGTK